MEYSQIVIEAALRSGAPEVPARAPHFVRQAERDLEKVMRVRQMEAEATVTAGPDGRAPLPTDFIALRSDGRGSHAVSGGALLIAPDETLDITYYARLPPLETADTNWLSESEPEIYINAVLVQIYSAIGDARLAAAVSILAERVRALIRDDKIARFNGQKIDISGQAR